MKYFLFNQRPGSNECAWRCLYSILMTYERIQIPYNVFLKECRRGYLQVQSHTGSASQQDVYDILDYHNIAFGASFPRSEGTFIVFYPTRPNYHAVIYTNEVVYDSELNKPLFLPLHVFIDHIRPKDKPKINRGLICVEIFGVSDSTNAWQKNELNSRSNPILMMPDQWQKEYSLMAGSSIGAWMNNPTKKLF